MEDDGWKRERIQEVQGEDLDDEPEMEIDDVGVSIVKESGRISVFKKEDDEDICQIDKNTTERSCQSS